MPPERSRKRRQPAKGRPAAKRAPSQRRPPAHKRKAPLPLIMLFVAVTAIVFALGSNQLFRSSKKEDTVPPAATTSSSPTPTTTAAPETTSAATTAAPRTRQVRVYVTRDGKLVPEAREVPDSPALATEALKALLGDRAFTLTIDGGVATVKDAGTFDRSGEAEVVATLTQFPTVQKVVLDGRALTRLDIEAQTPQILVEQPLPDARVASPLEISGTANTFEATFIAEILDAGGTSIAKKVVTATSGTGTRGTFATALAFTVDKEQAGTLWAYEASAEDGRPIHEVKVPLTLLPPGGD